MLIILNILKILLFISLTSKIKIKINSILDKFITAIHYSISKIQ